MAPGICMDNDRLFRRLYRIAAKRERERSAAEVQEQLNAAERERTSAEDDHFARLEVEVALAQQQADEAEEKANQIEVAAAIADADRLANANDCAASVQDDEESYCPYCFEPGGRYTWLEDRDGGIVAHHNLCRRCKYRNVKIAIRSSQWVTPSVARRIIRMLRTLSYEDKSRKSRYTYFRPLDFRPHTDMST